MARSFLLLTLAMMLAGCRHHPGPPLPLESLNAQQMHGYAVFQAQCKSCHYDRRNGGLNGPSLLGIFKEKDLPSGAAATDERVTATIVQGKRMMPAMADKMTEQELNDLMAYLHTL